MEQEKNTGVSKNSIFGFIHYLNSYFIPHKIPATFEVNKDNVERIVCEIFINGLYFILNMVSNVLFAQTL